MKNGVLLVGGAAATSLVTLLAMVSPALGLAAIVLLGFTMWAAYRPYAAACALAFLSAAFPKAGIKVADFPLPVFLVGLAVALVLAGVRQQRTVHSVPTTLLVGLYLVFVAVKTLTFLQLSVGTAAAFAAWTIGPVVLLYLATQTRRDDRRFQTWMERGFLLAVAYGLVQLFAGVEETAVPGLTHALGDDLTQKNNVIYASVGEDYSKIPSSYQNGNIFGLVAATFFAMALARVANRSGRAGDFLLLGGSALAIALSGSRTAIVAAGVGAVVVLFRGGHVGRKVLAVAVLLGVAFVVIRVQPGLAERYSLDNLLASGGAGRSDMWQRAIATHPLVHFVLGAPIDPQVEGGVGMLLRIGLVGVALLVACVAVLLRRMPTLRLPALVLLVGAVLDSSYLLFPTWFLLAAYARDERHLGTPPAVERIPVLQHDLQRLRR